MTNSTIVITYDAAQAENLVSKWNELANEANQLTADQAHLLFGDNAEDEMEQNGSCMVEVGRFKSRTGNPATFTIDARDVTLERRPLED